MTPNPARRILNSLTGRADAADRTPTLRAEDGDHTPPDPPDPRALDAPVDDEPSTGRPHNGEAQTVVRRITLISKPGCHLCDDARAVIERVAADVGAQVEEINMLDDPALVEKYVEQIPVTLVDGRQHDYWRVDETRLRRALAQPARVTDAQ